MYSLRPCPYPCTGGVVSQAPPTTTPLRVWRCFNPLYSQPAAAAAASRRARTEARSLPTEHRCAKPLEYPCAGEARTDRPGGLSLSDRQKGKSRGESMAVEEEGLRIFQSVKIKIGKKENNPPPPHTHPLESERFDGRLRVNGPSRQAGGAGWGIGEWPVFSLIIQITRCCFFKLRSSLQRKAGEPQAVKLWTPKGEIEHIGSLVGKLWEFGSWFKKPVSEFELWSNPNRLSAWTAPQLHGSRWLLPFFGIEFNYLNLYYTRIAPIHVIDTPPKKSSMPNCLAIDY